MQPSSANENNASSDLTKKQPINLQDDQEIIMEEGELSEEKSEMRSAASEEKRTETKVNEDTPPALKEKPVTVEMVACHAEDSKGEQENTSEQTKEKPAVVELITCHSEIKNDEVAKTASDKPATVEMVTSNLDQINKDTLTSSITPVEIEQLGTAEKQIKIDLPFSPTSVQPNEPYPQTQNEKDDEENPSKLEVKKVLNNEYKQQLLEGSEGIETIISSFFVILGELSKSVGCEKSIAEIKNELESFKEASSKISAEIIQGDVSEEKAYIMGEKLNDIGKDVRESVRKGKNVRDNEKLKDVDSKIFEDLLMNCQELISDLESLNKSDGKPNTPPSTPEEFHDAKEAISASASFVLKNDAEDKVGLKKEKSTDDIDGVQLSTITKEESTKNNSEPEAQTSFVTHQVKKFEEDENSCQEAESDSVKVTTKTVTEGIGKLKTKMIEETVTSESTVPQENGQTQTISQTVKRTITTVSDTALPIKNEEINVENIENSHATSTSESDGLDDAKDDSKCNTAKVEHPKAAQGNVAENFASLDSSDADRYHFATPPTMSLESDIQPCGIDLDTVKSDPLSLTSISEDILISESKSISSSSDYKFITEERSVSIEKYSSKNGQPTSDNLVVDSGTDDQMSSGTFSQDEISPRFADLPQQLNVEKKKSVSTSDAYKRSISDTLHQDLKKTTKDRSLSMETRSTSMTSDVSDQEIPPTTPRSDLTISPSSDAQVKFMYGDNIEKASTDTMDIMTQSIYVGSSDANDYDSEISSESHLSSVQKITTSDDSKVTTTLTEESTKVFESVRKLSENVTENIMEETKTITKSTKMAVEESFVSLKEENTDKIDSEDKLLKNKDSAESKQITKQESINTKDTTAEKSESLLKTVVSTESSVMVTKTDMRSYSDVLKSEKSIDSKVEKLATIDSEKEKEITVGKDAAAEIIKSDTVLQLVDSKESSLSDAKTKKLTYSEVLKSDSSLDKKDNDDKEDPIADWGKPLGLPSPIRPGTPAKQPKKAEEENLDTNKLKDSVEPVWMDLAYVPHHGASNYANAEFFKRVRARYYVFSGVEPSKEVFNALLEAKKTWENKEQEVTIIPTYDTDVLGYWVAENEELLTELKIDLAPSASRCTINLQDHATSCAAYRLEF